MRIRFVNGLFAVIGLVLAATTAGAQTGSISGRVTAGANGGPVADAQVRVMQGMSEVARGQTDAQGAYRIANVASGTYAVLVNRIGFAMKRVEGVSVGTGGTTALDIVMDEAASILDPVAVTGTRGAEPEKVLDSPNSISVVTAERIAERPAVTVTDHLKSQPGLSISNGGIAQANIVSRGFNNAFSTSMLMLQDYRFAGVPSLRVNVPFLFTGTGEDIARIEVLQGPASALYGPNSGAGVLHVITKSPFESQGTTLTLDGGERSLMRLGGRHAGSVGEKFGYKLSGEYFTARDWEYRDVNETELPPGSDPVEAQLYRLWSPTDPRVPASRQGVTKFRDFDLEKYSGEARFDYRPSEDTEFITTAGYSQIGRALEITTTFGAAQVKNWSYTNLQQRFRHKRFFAQVFFNQSDAGNDHALDDNGTYYLRSGIPVVDKSNVLVGQVQQSFNLSTTKFTAGLDYIATRPETEGTIMGRNEEDDNITETGAYLQLTHPLTDRLEFMGALRGDQNSRIEGMQFSPRAAFVYNVAENQNLRFTFNRAFNSPASFSFFLDQWSGVRQNLGPALGTTDVQIFGNPPKQGWRYDRGCDPLINGGLCMRSPLAGPNPVPATGANLLPGAMQAFGPALAAAVAQAFGLTPTQRDNITAALQGLSPTDAQLPGVLRNLGAPTAIVPFSSVQDFGPLGADFSNTWELGYKGLFGERLRIAVDYWYQIRPAEPTTQVINLDDAVFMAPGTPTTPGLITFLGGAMGPTLVANGVPAGAVPTVIGGWVTQLAALPGGMLNFNNDLYDRNYLVFTYQSATGQVDVHGLDFAADYLIDDFYSIEATYSNLARNVFAKAPGASAAMPLTANAPKHRATLTLRYNNQEQGLSGEVRGRYMDSFDVNSGVYTNFQVLDALPYERVPVNAFFDFGLSYRLPVAQNMRVGLNVQNLFDNRVPSFIGVPDVGRMVTTRLQYTF
jgi:outer membrane receptor for ferrienterochelin and colicins